MKMIHYWMTSAALRKTRLSVANEDSELHSSENYALIHHGLPRSSESDAMGLDVVAVTEAVAEVDGSLPSPELERVASSWRISSFREE